MNVRKLRILYNRRSGPGRSRFETVRRAVSRAWRGTADRAWYFPADREESDAMVDAAVAEGADCLLVCGGDGTASSVGRRLIGTSVALGVVPLGSGNGLARHFGIPLDPAKAVAALAAGGPRRMDVGVAGGVPFLVSASVAWDAALVRAYDAIPFRGAASYALAGFWSFFGYRAQPLEAVLDGTETLRFDKPLLFTVGNLAGWGGGALIDADASAEDGRLELIAGERRDAPRMLAALRRVFSKGGKALPHVLHRTFRSLEVSRPAAAPVQLDGELEDLPARFEISVRPSALGVLVPPAPSAPLSDSNLTTPTDTRP